MIAWLKRLFGRKPDEKQPEVLGFKLYPPMDVQRRSYEKFLLTQGFVDKVTKEPDDDSPSTIP